MSKSIAEIRIKPEKIEDFKRYAADLAGATRKETGCLFYELYQSNDDPAIFFFLEEWERPEHLNSHLRSPNVAEFGNRMEGITDGPVKPFNWVRVV
jgi:quinol monooxygenase YgiN